ncbi:membrane anchored junction protein [Phyllostomus discolor]|uniref:Membrane anchored junction protein n=1 Tax=Phyllostomus discolor TaxID=89673 RepID=A0A834A511_9CHIR|nr:membrane anchored junction protein [Phyllostomus discolor]
MTLTFPVLGKPMNDSALGLVLTEREAAGAVRKKRKRTEVPSTPSRPGPDRARMRTASQGPGRKKLPTETSRTRERRTPQECQEASALGVTDVQEQDSPWEDSQAGDDTLPGQQSSPPPPDGPGGLGTSGFLGFLSSLFPFRYFFRRSSQ